MFEKKYQDKINLILDLLNRKKFSEAEEELKKLILLVPNNFFLENIYGIILSSQNRYHDAINHFKKSIQMNQKFANAHYNLGSTFMKIGDYDNAIDSFKESIKINDNYFEAYFNLGDCYRKLEKFNEAFSSFSKCIEINKNDPDIYNNLGLLYYESKHFDLAILNFEKYLTFNPDSPFGYNNLGLVYFAQKDLNKAEKNFFKSVELKLDFSESYYNLGLIFNKKKEYQKAISFFKKAINLERNFYKAYSNLAISYIETEDYKSALDNVNLALKFNSVYPEGYFNRGFIYSILKEYNSAITDYDQALKLRPDYSEVYNYKGMALEYLNKFVEADKCYDNSKRYNPLNYDPCFNKGILNLKLKNFNSGWSGYEFRKKLDDRYFGQEELKKYDNYRLPNLDDLFNKNIFIYCEQGLGDTIQFSRYIKLLSDLGARVTFKVKKNLIRLFLGFNDYCDLTFEEVDLLKFDYICSLLSLPLIFNTTDKNIPNTTPYLIVDQQRNLFWKKELEKNNFKIGIHWRGNLKNKKMVDRSFNLELFSDIAEIKNITLVSLQKDFNPSIDYINKNINIKSYSDLDLGEDSFIDSATLINNLDLVISNDTSIVHLAGALGKPVWTVLNFNPDWRWFLNDNKSPWYPSMLLFRQKIDGSWKEPFNEIKSYLINNVLTK
jgi:tetratricopeptide (TPR) repeat protein